MISQEESLKHIQKAVPPAAVYQIGHPSLDDHHKEIFMLVHELDHAIRKHNRDEIQKILDIIQDYVLTHFEEEETLMSEHEFYGLSEHQAEHKILKDRAEILVQMFKEAYHFTHLAYSLRRFIDELISHILRIDVKMRALDSSHSKEHE